MGSYRNINAHPCPFCGSFALGIVPRGDTGVRVMCFTCKTSGPVANDEETAVYKWDNRKGQPYRSHEELMKRGRGDV